MNSVKKGSILLVTLIATVVGSIVIGSLLLYATKDSMLVEKEIGHVKSSEALKLSLTLYNTTVANETGLTDEKLETIRELIGGGGSDKSIFGTGNNTPSSIPGFVQYSINWAESTTTRGTTMQPPSNPNGFWYFPGTFTAKVIATHTGDGVSAVRDRSRAVISSVNELQTVPAFSMLSFYDKDWEISAHYESAQLIGHIHSNGSIFLDCRDSGPDRISFHGLQDFPILSANNTVYRRGRNGATSFYKFGSNANAGLDFWVYSESNFNSLISTTDYNFTNNNSRVFTRDLTPDFTSYEEGAINTDTGQEPVRRRFGGGTVGDDYGYVFTGTSLVNSNTFEAPTTGGDTVSVIQFGNEVDRLTPPVAINPYQYIEDIQYYDTPETVDYPAPASSNYQEDANNSSKVAQLAYNSIAPLIIRDGVAYYRTTPGGDLTPVISLLTTSDSLYPDDTHPDARRYGDLRWYGWFGMNDGVSPTPDNPARWHFPIKSITINATRDANNAGTTPTSTEGTASAFTFRSATIHTPAQDAVKNSSGVSVSCPWIDTSIDLHQISSNFPSFTGTGASDSETGEGIGIFNVSYPTIDGGGVEKYDPVRVAYNGIKAQLRTIYNATHIYTSRYGQIGGVYRMLNKEGTDPGVNTAPNVWGSGSGIMENSHGVDYDGDGTLDYSAFWNDDGALGTGGAFRYIRIKIYANNGHPTSVRITEIEFINPFNGNVINTGSMTTNQSSAQNSTKEADKVFDGDKTHGNSSSWDSAAKPTEASPQWMYIDAGANQANWINAGSIIMYMSTSAGNADAAPEDFDIEGSYDGTNWETLSEQRDITWTSGNTNKSFSMSGPKLYLYRRDASTSSTNVLNGRLSLAGEDTTPKVELFPIRHKSVTNMATAPTSMDDWYIYKSTLPFQDRTLAMPSSRQNLFGWDFTNNRYINANRTTNFGYCGSETGNHNWYVLANNAPEMLARSNSGGSTFETQFRYYAGDFGGYYGNDNLCMIDLQERKIVVFTEIDLAELTSECLSFNKLDTAWGFTFDNNTANINSQNALQNIIYVVNTSMGKNFYGKRVHCGAVRLKRGRIISHPLSIATPNALHIWGDYNCPGYWHHGKNGGSTSVSYNVPTFREHAPDDTISSQPAGFYADSLSAYENSWIPFNVAVGSRNSIYDQYNGTFQNSVSYRTNENISFDHKLWWEDDGMRREGNGTSVSGNGAQLFLNYHEMIFNHDDNDCYLLDSAWGNSAGANTNTRGSSNQIWKHIPQGINAGLMYGNVESKLPSFFYTVDVSAIPVSRPSCVDELDWYMTWIPRNRWVELQRNQMRNDINDTVNNDGFDPSAFGGAYYGSSLTPSDYYGTNFPGSGNTEWENCKLKFSGGGFMYDIRFHTNHTHNLSEWRNGRQEFGRNIQGAFACMFDSRQSTTGFNTTMLGTENQQIFYSYNTSFNDASNLPPGTPLMTIVPEINYTLEGTKWEY